MSLPETIDKFQVIQHIGNGHFGDVFLCYDPYLKKERAIKVIKVSNPDEFVKALKEGQTLDLCRHKHIVDVKDIETTLFSNSVVVAIIMEYLSKGSIQKHLENNFISCKESCIIIQDSLLGLEHAHNNNVLHRDIKPGNILFGDSGKAKLSDFGLALNYRQETPDLAGYIPHLSLEVLEGAPMSKISDIYAMGISFYRIINNLPSLPYLSHPDLAKAVKKDKYPSRDYMTHIPDKITRIINKAIHKNSVLRFQSCSEFRQALERLNFNIDWVKKDATHWVGNSIGGRYEIRKIQKRTGWCIEFTRNGRKENKYCYSNLSQEKNDIEFHKIIKETTLHP